MALFFCKKGEKIMVFVKGFEKHYNTKTVEVELFADEKSEITDDITIDGMPKNYTIEPGSSAMTANGEIAFRKSDNTWNWLGEEG